MSATAAGSLEPALAVRDSGLIVPAHLRELPEHAGAAEDPDENCARDADGRRRIVLTKETRKRFTRMAGDLDRENLVFVLVCKPNRQVTKHATDIKTGEKVPVVLQEPIPGACGEVMKREGEGTHDPGFGCTCTRLHFTRF
jgi:hypothetical protein